MKSKFLSIILVLALLCGGLCAQAATVYGAAAVSTANPTIAAASAVPDYGWQKSVAFPDWKGYTDDTLVMNSMVSFKFWQGQGTLWLEVAKEVKSFSLYVNGRKCDTSKVGAGIWAVDFSKAAVNGMNTLQVSNILPLNLKNAVKAYIPYPTVINGQGSLEGIRPQTLDLISDMVETDVSYGFPSAQLAIVKNGKLVYENAWGRVNSYEKDGTPKTDSAPVTVNTLYDLASVTKMFSVNYAIQKLVTDGKLDIDSTIVEILGDRFADATLDRAYKGIENPPDNATQKKWKRALTVKDILRHQGGFPAGPAYYNPNSTLGFADAVPGVNPCYAVTKEQTLEAIFKTPLEYEPGTKTVYSDVDYMLLTYVVEKITGQPLDKYMKETFYAPMGLTHMTFLPLENGFKPEDCAATELNGNTRDGYVKFDGIRTETLQGEVHDEKAWECMGGVSGHAGLFSNASDLAKLASVMFTGGYGKNRFFSQDVMDLFTAPKSLDFGQWGLGWWRQGTDKRVWYFGTQAPSETIGHQGWTGTLVVIDPSRDLVIAYLTNKINSPIIDTSVDANGFSGKCFTASTLGFVAQILSIGMDTSEDISEQLLDLTADMAAESLKKIPEGAQADHPYVKNSQSKIDVLRKWAKAAGSAKYAAFADELTGMLPRDAVGGFTDVSVKDWYATGVRYCAENGLMNGVSATRFAPNLTAGRDTLVTILCRMAGSSTPSAVAVFPDAQGDTLTREQLAVMLYRMAGIESDGGAMGLAGYEDATAISDWAYEAMQWAVRSGIIKGGNTNTLRPGDSVNRAELATIVMRFAEL